MTFPSLTPTSSGGELYFAFALSSGSCEAGSSSGYTYDAPTVAGDAVVYDPDVTATSSPTMSQTGTQSVTTAALFDASAGPNGSPAYDTDGNTTSISGQSVGYDAQDHAVSVASANTTTTYTLDALERVVQREVTKSGALAEDDLYAYSGDGASPSSITAVPVGTVGAPYPSVAAVPGIVQGANYDTGGQGVGYSLTSVNGTANSYRSDGVDLETVTDSTDTTGPGAGYDIGWTTSGQWFRYTVNVASAGTYTVSLRLASPSGVTDALHISNIAGTNLSGSVNAPDTGGWQSWTTVTTSVTLPAGLQTLVVNQDNGGWNIHFLSFAASGDAPFSSTPVALPGTVQAANYDTGGQGVGYSVSSSNGSANSYRSDGVDLEAVSDSTDLTGPGAGYDIGWTTAGQWFRYSVNVATAGTYTVSLRLASPSGVTDALHISNLAGANLSGSVNAPETSGWENWTTVTASVTLPAGLQTLVVNQDNSGWNIHFMSFATSASTTSVTDLVDLTGGVLLEVTGASQAWFYSNLEGGTAAQAGAAGTAVGGVTLYDPFGNQMSTLQTDSPDGLAYGFEGKNGIGTDIDAGGVVLMGARLYDPTVGRFLQVDPLFGFVDSMNAYDYCGQDPLSCEDLNGFAKQQKYQYTAAEIAANEAVENGWPCDAACQKAYKSYKAKQYANQKYEGKQRAQKQRGSRAPKTPPQDAQSVPSSPPTSQEYLAAQRYNVDLAPIEAAFGVFIIIGGAAAFFVLVFL